MRDSIIEILGGASQHSIRELEARLAESENRFYEAGYYDGVTLGGNDEPPSGVLASYGYKRVMGGNLRDFSNVDRPTVDKTLMTLRASSPTARRLIEIVRDHVVGRGVAPKVRGDGATAQKWQYTLDKFWNKNKMDRHLPEMVFDLFFDGELVLPAFCYQNSTGRVTVGYLESSVVDEVITNPHNAKERVAVVTRQMVQAYPGHWTQEQRVYRIVQDYQNRLVTHNQASNQDALAEWELVMLSEHGKDKYDGDVFLATVNNATNQPRGWSDLLPLVDWIDLADAVLFALGEREQIAALQSWDVTIEGDPDAVKKRAREIMANPPKKDSINIHNDKELWNWKFPDLKQNSSIETYRAIMAHIMSGMGFPRHWFAEGDGTNRATAYAQQDPTYKTLEYKQSIIRHLLDDICRFVIDQAVARDASYIDTTGQLSIYVDMPEVAAKSIIGVSETLGGVVAGATAAVSTMLMSRQTGIELICRLLTEYGMEIDPKEEAERINQEQERDALGGQLAMGEWAGDTIAHEFFDLPPSSVSNYNEFTEGWLRNV